MIKKKKDANNLEMTFGVENLEKSILTEPN